MTHAHGKSLNIITFNGSVEVDFNKTALEELLLHPDVRKRKIVVLSIVGPFRKGKTFFLDYCLRFLYGNYKSINYPNNPLNDSVNWMGNADEPLTGFSWRSGTTRETTGIDFWSDVFLCHDPKGQELAILVVDTQGLFDNVTTVAENSKIFSLSSLLTSIQILNLNGVIHENDLQYLQFGIQYAKFSSSSGQQNFKPFQSFMFLIRDWNYPDDHPFGLSGGQKYLDDTLVVKTNQFDELKSVREDIQSSFEKLSCCLLPHPGKNVARVKGYDGRRGLMDVDFQAELKLLIAQLLKSENLVTKKINNVEMNGEIINEIFQQYVGLYKAGSSIAPQSIFETTVEKFMTAFVLKCFEIYKKNVYSRLNSFTTKVSIKKVYDSGVEPTIAAYNAGKKMGSSEHIKDYRSKLRQMMANDYIEWKETAENKVQAKLLMIKIQTEEAKRQRDIRLENIRNQKILDDQTAEAILQRKINNEKYKQQLNNLQRG